MLVAHVERIPGAALSPAVNAALIESALAAYREWDAQAGPEERAALTAFSAHDDTYWAAE